jgi:DNA-directed RNA polymerase
MNDLDRQYKLEADAIQDGILRYFQNREYQVASDTKPGRDLVGNCLKPLADAILEEQLALKTSQRQKLPNYGLPLLSISHEKLALITLCTLLNAISRSEFEEGQDPATTVVAYEIGQRCRLERIYDRLRRRQVDVAHELCSRNRNRNAWRRAEEFARKVDDLDDWSRNFRSYHLGQKLIALAVRFTHFDGQPVFELKTVQDAEGKRIKTTRTVALATAAGDWIARHPWTLESLPSPVHLPMIVRPRPWTSLAGGGYLMTPMTLLKRYGKRAQQILANADLSVAYSAVNALQSNRLPNQQGHLPNHAPGMGCGQSDLRIEDACRRVQTEQPRERVQESHGAPAITSGTAAR